MAPQARAPHIKIGFPRDVGKAAKEKEALLYRLLGSRARAWDGYFDGLSLAYIPAHSLHLGTLDSIKEQIRNQQEFLRSVVLGTLLPAMVGGGMSALVADKGASVTKALLPVATKRQAALATFAVGGAATITEDVVKQEVTSALSGLVPEPGSEWDAVGDSPFEFFLKLRKMVNDYSTDVTRAVERARQGPFDSYVNLVNAHPVPNTIEHAAEFRGTTRERGTQRKRRETFPGAQVGSASPGHVQALARQLTSQAGADVCSAATERAPSSPHLGRSRPVSVRMVFPCSPTATWSPSSKRTGGWPCWCCSSRCCSGGRW